MIKVPPTMRISLGLVLVTTSILLAANAIGLVPDRSQTVLDARKQLCESLAVLWAVSAQENDLAATRATMQLAADGNADILSAAVRSAEGAILAEAGDHQRHWAGHSPQQSTPTHVRVPIFKGNTRWGTVEIRFKEIGHKGILGSWAGIPIALIVFVATAGLVGYLLVMRRSLRPVAPSSIVPLRIEAGEREGATISLRAANSLMFALAYRDVGTAEHSQQVASLCVATARELIPPSECFMLEVAADLHDIGKLGVPDEILLKPGPLTEEEARVMHSHRQKGAEIIASTFSSPKLIEIVRNQLAWYGGSFRDPSLPVGDDIPLEARILAIADAFSSMVSRRPYREPRSCEEAIEELRCFAGTQFDPELVDRFAEAVMDRDHSRNRRKLGVSRAVKLEIGQEVERLVDALSDCDFSGASTIASRLAATATKQGFDRVANLTAKIARSASQGPNLDRIAQLITELTSICPLRPTREASRAAAREDHCLQT